LGADFCYRGCIYLDVKLYFFIPFIHFNFIKKHRKNEKKRCKNGKQRIEKKIEKLKEEIISCE